MGLPQVVEHIFNPTPRDLTRRAVLGVGLVVGIAVAEGWHAYHADPTRAVVSAATIHFYAEHST